MNYKGFGQIIVAIIHAIGYSIKNRIFMLMLK